MCYILYYTFHKIGARLFFILDLTLTDHLTRLTLDKDQSRYPFRKRFLVRPCRQGDLLHGYESLYQIVHGNIRREMLIGAQWFIGHIEKCLSGKVLLQSSIADSLTLWIQVCHQSSVGNRSHFFVIVPLRI